MNLLELLSFDYTKQTYIISRNITLHDVHETTKKRLYLINEPSLFSQWCDAGFINFIHHLAVSDSALSLIAEISEIMLQCSYLAC